MDTIICDCSSDGKCVGCEFFNDGYCDFGTCWAYTMIQKRHCFGAEYASDEKNQYKIKESMKPKKKKKKKYKKKKKAKKKGGKKK